MSTLGHHGKTLPPDLLGRLVREIDPFQLNLAVVRTQDGGDGEHERRLALAVWSKEGGHFRRRHGERHLSHYVTIAAGDRHPLDEERHSCSSVPKPARTTCSLRSTLPVAPDAISFPKSRT